MNIILQMKSIILVMICIFGINRYCGAQSLFERFPGDPSKITVVVASYNDCFVLVTNGNAVITNRIAIKECGSGVIYGVPFQGVLMPCVVTALHVVRDVSSGANYDGVLVKLNMPESSRSRFVKIPLFKSANQNFWVSEKGCDLVLIPLPQNATVGADITAETEDQIVTPETAIKYNITSGLIAVMYCVQFEYMDRDDWLSPRNVPILRIGHVARMGFKKGSDGTEIVKTHLVDIHSSPGNSGAIVIAVLPSDDHLTSKGMFLGIVKGFNDEIGSYKEYKTSVISERNAINIVNQKTGETNQIVLAVKTIANPNLTDITPVFELSGIESNSAFLRAAMISINYQWSYEIWDGILPH